MKFIKDLVIARLSNGELSREIAIDFGISVSMVSSYKLHGYNPSLSVAKTIYKKYNIILHPFSEESLQYEISKDKKCTI